MECREEVMCIGQNALSYQYGPAYIVMRMLVKYFPCEIDKYYSKYNTSQ